MVHVHYLLDLVTVDNFFPFWLSSFKAQNYMVFFEDTV